MLNYLSLFRVTPLITKIFLVGGIIIVAGWTYYQYIQKDRERLRNELQQERFVIEQQKQIIQRNQADYEKIIVVRDKLQKEILVLQQERNRLQDTLFRETQNKLSLEELARQRPSLIERKINNSTKNVFDCFEIISKGDKC